VVKSVHGKNGRAAVISEEKTVKRILNADSIELEGEVDPADLLRLKKGRVIEMWPTDSDMNRHDKGALLSIEAREVCVKSEVLGGKWHLRIHYPRNNFKIILVRSRDRL
jgi:hypothetical protein